MPDDRIDPVAREDEAARPVRRGLRAGSRAGLGVAALLAVWAVMVLAWPVAVTGADGAVVACGTPAGASASSGAACLAATGQLRVQALALLAAAVVVAITAIAVFGSEPVDDDTAP